MTVLPNLEDFQVSSVNGFLPTQPPLESLPDSYFAPWENIIHNLQGLILSKRLRQVVDELPILSTSRLSTEPQWRRAYSILAFIVHAYVWGDSKPNERIPPPLTIPFLATCAHLELPPVATYAGLVLWNWKPLFPAESVDTLANLDTLDTFTGSLDEKWFYLVSIAIEARAAPIIPLMLHAIEAVERADSPAVTAALRTFAERLDELGSMLARMTDNCDPHVFYHRIRPYLAGSKNMSEAGLPNGVVFDNGGPINKQRYVQFSGGSNAQSSIIQFFDIVLGIQHRPTGVLKPDPSSPKYKLSGPSLSFIHDQRRYMPGPHARFLAAMTHVANIQPFVRAHPEDTALGIAYDACLAMLSAFRDRHIQLVSRYIIIKSREAKSRAAESKPSASPAATTTDALPTRPKPASQGKLKSGLTGTGGTSLIPFLRQARDETAEPAVHAWTQRLLGKEKNLLLRSPVADAQGVEGGLVAVDLAVKPEQRVLKEERGLGMTTTWEQAEGGLCNW